MYGCYGDLVPLGGGLWTCFTHITHKAWSLRHFWNNPLGDLQDDEVHYERRVRAPGGQCHIPMLEDIGLNIVILAFTGLHME